MSHLRSYSLIGHILLLILLTAASPLRAENNLLSLTPTEKAYLKTKGKLTIVCDPAWPPYEYLNKNGKYEGFSIDYHALLAERIGIPIEQILTTSWSESLQLAIEGNCDLVSTLNKTPIRERFLDFTDPFMDTIVVIIGKKDCNANCLNDFAGRVFAIVKGYRMEEDISRDYPKILHHLVNTPTESLQAVAEAKADATIATLIEANHHIRINNLENLTIIGETQYKNHHRIGVRKGDALLLSIMQKAVRSLSPADRLVIENKWLSVEESGFSTIPKFAVPLFVVSLLLLVPISLLMTRRKKRKTKK